LPLQGLGHADFEYNEDISENEHGFEDDQVQIDEENSGNISECNSYDNKRLLIQSHAKSIYELPCIRDESADKLRQFTNALNQHRHAIQALDHGLDQWGA